VRFAIFAFALLLVGPVNNVRAAPPRTNEVVRLPGRVSQLPGPGTNLVFKIDSGKQLKLARTPQAEALFLDTNLWSRVLLLTGKEHDKSFEVTGNLHSIKNGKVYELFYYCDVCSIASSTPGLCQCCREPTVLTEKLATN
jgi:hypothetical protein